MLAWIKKHKILLILELLCIAIFLPGCFAKEKLVLVNDECFGNGVLRIEDIVLRPGVYQVRIQAAAQEDESIYLNMQCEQSTFKALRCNGAYVLKGQEYVTFEAYVHDDIDTAYIECMPSGLEYYSLSIEIVKLNWGNRMIVFCIAVGCMLLNMLLRLREQILLGVISKDRQMAGCMLLLGIAIAYFPYATDYFTIVGDGAFHLERIEGLTRTLQQAIQFPVRVQSYWLYDHGYAVSIFCGDTFLVIPALLRMIGFPIMTSYKIFLFLVFAATAGIAYYSFQKCTGSVYVAAFGSFLYTIAPYYIYNVYNRQAVDEYLGIVFLPLVISGMFRLYTEDMHSSEYYRAKVPLIIGLTCLLQTHLQTCVMVAGCVGIFCIFMYKKTFKRPLFMELLKAVAAWLGLTCWFYLPLLIMMQKDRYVLHKLKNQNAEPLKIGIVLTLMLSVFFISYVRKLRNKEERSRLDRIMLQKGTIILVFVFALGTAVYQVNDIAFYSSVARLYSVEYIGTVNVADGAYLLQESPIEGLRYHLPVADEGLEYSNYEREGTNISLTICNTEAEELYLELPLMGYKGYEIHSDEAENVPYLTEQRGAHGDLRIAVPAGYQGEISVAYKGFLSFRIAEMISLVSVVALISMAYYRRRKEKMNGKSDEV